MKYIISRASYWNDLDNDKPPVEGCVKEEVHQIMWDGSIDKDTTEMWTLEIDSLLNFVDKYGSIVIEISKYAEYPKEIIIYDDYIE